MQLLPTGQVDNMNELQHSKGTYLSIEQLIEAFRVIYFLENLLYSGMVKRRGFPTWKNLLVFRKSSWRGSKNVIRTTLMTLIPLINLTSTNGIIFSIHNNNN
jgi:hypothetical protein